MYKKIKENIYIIIPIICIGVWALICIYIFRSSIITTGYFHSDVLAFRLIGYNMVYDPSKNYPGFWYMPISGYFLFLTCTIWPYIIAHWIMFSLNLISGALLIIEFDKILKLEEVQEKIHRFLFLMIAANGWNFYWQFHTNSYKLLTGFIIMLILRREIEWNKNKKEKEFKYYILNYGLFVFILGWAPYLVYFLILYVFYNIRLKFLFKKENIIKYLIIVSMFLIQNFLFIIYP
ncbi:MAG: hypothetical protein ACFFDN_43945, partial [Candidatus Hodarchaeota archaeon]